MIKFILGMALGFYLAQPGSVEKIKDTIVKSFDPAKKDKDKDEDAE